MASSPPRETAPTERPSTKASFAHTIQTELQSLPPETQRKIRERTGPAYERIAAMLPIEWVEESDYNALTNGVRGVLGDPGTRQFFRGIGRRFLRSPSVQSAVEGIFHVLGISPHSLLKLTPRGRASVTRNAGTLKYVYVDKRIARLELRDFPPSTYRHGTTAELLAGTWLGLLDALGQPGQIELQNVSLERGHTDFVIRW